MPPSRSLTIIEEEPTQTVFKSSVRERIDDLSLIELPTISPQREARIVTKPSSETSGTARPDSSVGC